MCGAVLPRVGRVHVGRAAAAGQAGALRRRPALLPLRGEALGGLGATDSRRHRAAAGGASLCSAVPFGLNGDVEHNGPA